MEKVFREQLHVFCIKIKASGDSAVGFIRLWLVPDKYVWTQSTPKPAATRTPMTQQHPPNGNSAFLIILQVLSLLQNALSPLSECFVPSRNDTWKKMLPTLHSDIRPETVTVHTLNKTDWAPLSSWFGEPTERCWTTCSLKQTELFTAHQCQGSFTLACLDLYGPSQNTYSSQPEALYGACCDKQVSYHRHFLIAHISNANNSVHELLLYVIKRNIC